MLNVKLNVSITLIVRQKLWNFLIASPDPYSSHLLKKIANYEPPKKHMSKMIQVHIMVDNCYSIVTKDATFFISWQNLHMFCILRYFCIDVDAQIKSLWMLNSCDLFNLLYYSFCLALIWTCLELMNCCISFSMAIIKLTLHSYKHKQWYFYQAVFIFRPDKKINWPRPRKSYSTTNYAI